MWGTFSFFALRRFKAPQRPISPSSASQISTNLRGWFPECLILFHLFIYFAVLLCVCVCESEWVLCRKHVDDLNEDFAGDFFIAPPKGKTFNHSVNRSPNELPVHPAVHHMHPSDPRFSPRPAGFIMLALPCSLWPICQTPLALSICPDLD